MCLTFSWWWPPPALITRLEFSVVEIGGSIDLACELMSFADFSLWCDRGSEIGYSKTRDGRWRRRRRRFAVASTRPASWRVSVRAYVRVLTIAHPLRITSLSCHFYLCPSLTSIVLIVGGRASTPSTYRSTAGAEWAYSLTRFVYLSLPLHTIHLNACRCFQPVPRTVPSRPTILTVVPCV